ncbi:MAG: hypothetical protein JWR37_2935 [Mycobacterium sp.]|nr:hypothetical protein [Mycobacterium sp.]
MITAYVVVTVATIIANAAVAIADLARAEFVLKNSAEVGVAESRIPLLATLKDAGALGLLLGLLGIPLIGMAAAVGLVLFFVGAVIVHVRTHVFQNIAFPTTFLALAVASLVLGLQRGLFQW